LTDSQKVAIFKEEGLNKEKNVLKAQDFVEARLYDNEEEVIQDALSYLYLLRNRPDLRLELAIHRYQHEPISLAKAAYLAGVSWAQMREILLLRGIQPRLGPETEAEVQALRDHFEICYGSINPVAL
jgi:predicted HTH domain antitoxin